MYTQALNIYISFTHSFTTLFTLSMYTIQTYASDFKYVSSACDLPIWAY